MDWSVILAYGFGLLLIYVLARVLYLPLRFAFNLLINAVLGGVALAAINLVGRLFGFMLPLNPFTALLVGILGVPGVILLIVLKYFVFR
ncbi:MAG: pro-sigmaK processing inhibitor BofA family protein [Actinobacteria bacterium]|nr:pro-sigmaK processing inhibitor BofA family protein [Actinomycetota bacterium]